MYEREERPVKSKLSGSDIVNDNVHEWYPIFYIYNLPCLSQSTSV